MQTISNVLKWIFVSSADASKLSLSVKMFGLGIIPYFMQAVGISCGLHIVCPTVSADLLTQVVSTISDVVFLSLTLVSSVGFAAGLIRKVILSLQGQNAAFANPQG